MRNRITVIGASQTAVTSTLLLAQRDYAELVLVDAGARVAEDVLAAGRIEGFAPGIRAGRPADIAGSDVVVVTELAAGLPADLAMRSPDAVAVVATTDCEADCAALLAGTRWPRGRVIGVVPGGGPLATATAVRAICDSLVLDRRTTHECLVMHAGEGGADGWAVAAVTLGSAGVEAIG